MSRMKRKATALVVALALCACAGVPLAASAASGGLGNLLAADAQDASEATSASDASDASADMLASSEEAAASPASAEAEAASLASAALTPAAAETQETVQVATFEELNNALAASSTDADNPTVIELTADIEAGGTTSTTAASATAGTVNMPSGHYAVLRSQGDATYTIKATTTATYGGSTCYGTIATNTTSTVSAETATASNSLSGGTIAGLLRVAGYLEIENVTVDANGQTRALAVYSTGTCLLNDGATVTGGAGMRAAQYGSNVTVIGSTSAAGTLVMNEGAKIQGGTSACTTGSVQLYGDVCVGTYATFTMNGGEITGFAPYSDARYATSLIYVSGGATFTMNDGIIDKNVLCNSSATTGATTGLIQAYSSTSIIRLLGGEITGNTAYAGGIVYLCHPDVSLTLGGDIDIHDNTMLAYGGTGIFLQTVSGENTITIASTLTSENKIEYVAVSPTAPYVLAAPASGYALMETDLSAFRFYDIASKTAGIEATEWTSFSVNADGALTVSATGSSEQTTDISTCTIALDAESYAYAGSAGVTPAVTVTDGEKELVQGTDYYVACGNNVNAGSDAYVMVYGAGSYSGAASKSFTISARSLDDEAVVCGELGSKVTTGSQVKPIPTIVLNGSYTLEYGTDFTCTWGANNTAGEAAGTVTVQGIGNFEGTLNLTFDIVSYEYSGQAFAVETREGLVEAIEAATGTKDSPTLVILNADIALQGSIDIAAGKNIWIEGNGYSLTQGEYVNDVAKGAFTMAECGEGESSYLRFSNLDVQLEQKSRLVYVAPGATCDVDSDVTIYNDYGGSSAASAYSSLQGSVAYNLGTLNFNASVRRTMSYTNACLPRSVVAGSGEGSVTTLGVGANFSAPDYYDEEGNAHAGGYYSIVGYNSVAYVTDSATLNIDGAVFDACGAWGSSSSSGVVYAYMADIVMNSGSIMNIGEEGSTYGSAVYALNPASSFTMNGGTICNNSNPNGSSTYVSLGGGAFTISGATVTINDGEIYGNSAKQGGAFNLVTDGSTLVVNGGSIHDNEACGDLVSSSGLGTTSSTTWGHGGFAVLQGGTITVNGGEIYDNTATISDDIIDDITPNADYGSGGFVYVKDDDCSLNLNGGSIHDNTADRGYDGVAVADDDYGLSIGLSGDASMTDEFYITSESTVAITGALGEGFCMSNILLESSEFDTFAQYADLEEGQEEFASSADADKFTITNSPYAVSYDAEQRALVRGVLDIGKYTVTFGEDSYTYTGSAIEPTFTVSDAAGATYTPMTGDYTASYESNTEAGTGYVVLTGGGDSATGQLRVPFVIDPCDISSEAVSIAFEDEYVLTGTSVEVKPVITYGSMTLVEGQDYDLYYSNNAAVGTGSVLIVAKGNYTGSVGATFAIVEDSEGSDSVTFTDVPDLNPYYYEAVYGMAGLGVITGYENGSFGVGDQMKRQDFVTILWRYVCPDDYAAYDASAAVDSSGLSDAEDGEYYTAAINWAVENGYVTGYTEGEDAGKFGVGDSMTFEQMVTIVARICIGDDAAKAHDTSSLFSGAYSDAGQVSSYAQGAMAWAVDEGLAGVNTSLLSPTEYVARERVAVVLWRAIDEKGLL